MQHPAIQPPAIQRLLWAAHAPSTQRPLLLWYRAAPAQKACKASAKAACKRIRVALAIGLHSPAHRAAMVKQHNALAWAHGLPLIWR